MIYCLNKNYDFIGGWNMRKLSIMLIIIVFFLSLSHSVFAAPIKYDFSGTITEMSAFGVEPPGSVVDAFTGYLIYVYDPDIEPLPGSDSIYPFLGSYFFEFNGFEIQNSGNSFSWQTVTTAHEADPTNLWMGDENPTHQDLIDSIGISLNITFSTGSVACDSNPGGPGFDMVGAIDSISVSTTPVPEPSSIFLLSSGLIGLAGFKRKFKL